MRSFLVPRVYCAILRTVVLNSMTLSLDRICIDVGPGKCDGALHIARVLADTLPIPVECTENRDTMPFGWPLCQAEMPLMEKFGRISRSVQSAAPHKARTACTPLCGFWGVPPRKTSTFSGGVPSDCRERQTNRYQCNQSRRLSDQRHLKIGRAHV